MEYLNSRGEYADPPFEEMNRDFAKYYPRWGKAGEGADFDREVAQEVAQEGIGEPLQRARGPLT
jgi:hypothetical protein